MTLSFAGQLDHSTVVQASDVVAELVSRPEVAAAWDRESSCAGMSVGGLTRHLVGQPATVVSLLRAQPPADAETVSVLQHYGRAAWVREDLDGQMNRSIRDTADQQAAEGFEAALDVLAAARADLPAVLAGPPTATYVPWMGWALNTDDFLVVRLMEMVVHSDDLAASVDVATADFMPDVLDPVLRLLTALAVRRHGEGAVVRALTRPQRAKSSISAF